MMVTLPRKCEICGNMMYHYAACEKCPPEPSEIARLRADNARLCSMVEEQAADVVGLRAALTRLVSKLTAIEADPAFVGIWPLLYAHGCEYNGPNWRDELADARLALSPPPQEAER